MLTLLAMPGCRVTTGAGCCPAPGAGCCPAPGAGFWPAPGAGFCPAPGAGCRVLAGAGLSFACPALVCLIPIGGPTERRQSARSKAKGTDGMLISASMSVA